MKETQLTDSRGIGIKGEKKESDRERKREKGQQRKRQRENRERVSRSFTGTKPEAEPVRCKQL